VKNIFSPERLEKCNFVVRRGTARSTAPAEREALPRRGSRGGFGREPRGRGGRLRQLAAGRGGTGRRSTPFRVSPEDPAADSRGGGPVAQFPAFVRARLPPRCPRPTGLRRCAEDSALGRPVPDPVTCPRRPPSIPTAFLTDGQHAPAPFSAS